MDNNSYYEVKKEIEELESSLKSKRSKIKDITVQLSMDFINTGKILETEDYVKFMTSIENLLKGALLNFEKKGLKDTPNMIELKDILKIMK
jgi:hypothetical protein